jgi:recombination protein RecA
MALKVNGEAGTHPSPATAVTGVSAAVQSIAKPKFGTEGESAAVMAQLAKQKGPGLVMAGSSIPRVERIPTGVWEFDYATGGGFPKGRYSIVFGPESSGKTNICYCAVANAQRGPAHCNKVVWIDLEGTFDPEWAAMFGVDVDALILVKPAYGEEAVDAMDAFLYADDVALVILDSLAVITSTKELEQSAEKFDVGTASILIKRMCNKIVIAQSVQARKGHFPAVILVNQIRMKIGVMFGDPETMPGGNTMKFLSSLTVRLYGKNVIDAKIHPDLPIFKDTSAVIKKAKVAVRQMSFEYKLCMTPHGDLSVGESDSWNSVSSHLKALNLLRKADKGTGWVLEGQGNFPTLVPLKDTYQAEREFALFLQKMVLDATAGQAFLIEAEGAAK